MKYADAPGLTRSIHIARADLELERVLVVYPGSRAYELDQTCEVIPLALLQQRLGDA